MIKLYHLENSRSLRILWLLEETGIPYELDYSERDPKTRLGPDGMKKVHPQGTWPTITDGDMALAESGAIVEYLTRKPEGQEWRVKDDDPKWPDYVYWLHYAEATLMPFSVMTLVLSEMVKGAPGIVRPILKRAESAVQERYIHPKTVDQLELIDRHLAGKQYFMGDRPTGADVMMIFPLETVFARMDEARRYTNIEAWVRRVHDRPAYRKTLEKGGNYDYAPLD